MFLGANTYLLQRDNYITKKLLIYNIPFKIITVQLLDVDISL